MDRALTVPELLEMILLYCPSVDILRLQRVNRFWADLISSSLRLRQSLFVEPKRSSHVWELGLVDPFPDVYSDGFEALMQRKYDCGLQGSITWGERVPVRRIQVEQDNTETRFGPLTMVAVNGLLIDSCHQDDRVKILYDIHWPLESRTREEFSEGEVVPIRQFSGEQTSHGSMNLCQPPAKNIIVIIAAKDSEPGNSPSDEEEADIVSSDDGVPRPIIGKDRVTNHSGVRYQQVTNTINKLKANTAAQIRTNAFVKLLNCATLSAKEEAKLEMEIKRGWKI